MKAVPLLSEQRRCDIYFRRSGRIDISSSTAKRLGLNEGDMLNLAMIEGELYLYISHKAVEGERRRLNSVHPSKDNYHHFRCQYLEMTRCVARYTGNAESWLYTGKTKDLTPYGIPHTGIILIYKNNKYNGNKND